MAEEPNPADLEIADELIAERRSEAPGETPEDMTSWQRPITAAIDLINYRAGQIIALLLVPLIAVVVFEVFSRNSFSILQNAGFEDLARSLNLGPTLWVYDTSRMIAVLVGQDAGNRRRNVVFVVLYSFDDLLHDHFSKILVARLFNWRNNAGRQCLGSIVMARAPRDACGCFSVSDSGHSGDFPRFP